MLKIVLCTDDNFIMINPSEVSILANHYRVISFFDFLYNVNSSYLFVEHCFLTSIAIQPARFKYETTKRNEPESIWIVIILYNMFQGSLQVWAYSGADTVQSDAKKIGISSDENNVAPPHLDILIGMDMGHGDFVFQQGKLQLIFFLHLFVLPFVWPSICPASD